MMRLRSFKARDLGSFLWVIVILSLAIVIVSGYPQADSQTIPTAKSAAHQNQIARGSYIVNDVAMCGMCHTPRIDSGELDTSRPLAGGAVWLLPAHPTADWPLKAPRLAGTPPASDQDKVRLLMTGVWTNGAHLRPPMPQFRMDRQDAEAVVAYLRSLRPEPGE